MTCQAGVANFAPIRAREHRIKLQVAAPNTTAAAIVSDPASRRGSLPAWEPMTPSQNAMFQGLVSASVNPST